MMTPEQRQAAYDKGQDALLAGNVPPSRRYISSKELHAAGLAEVERVAAASALEESLELLAHIVAQANVNPVEGDDGFIARYDMPVGSIHKAIPFLARHGIVVTQYGFIRRAAEIRGDE